MGVYISGMEMPTDCTMCPLYVDEDYNTREHCNYGWQKLPPIRNGVPDFCPLAHVPPHGRLIDADELYHQMAQLDSSWEYGQGVADCFKLLENAPTIVRSVEK